MPERRGPRIGSVGAITADARPAGQRSQDAGPGSRTIRGPAVAAGRQPSASDDSRAGAGRSDQFDRPCPIGRSGRGPGDSVGLSGVSPGRLRQLARGRGSARPGRSAGRSPAIARRSRVGQAQIARTAPVRQPRRLGRGRRQVRDRDQGRVAGSRAARPVHPTAGRRPPRRARGEPARRACGARILAFRLIGLNPAPAGLQVAAAAAPDHRPAGSVLAPADHGHADQSTPKAIMAIAAMTGSGSPPGRMSQAAERVASRESFLGDGKRGHHRPGEEVSCESRECGRDSTRSPVLNALRGHRGGRPVG